MSKKKLCRLKTVFFLKSGKIESFATYLYRVKWNFFSSRYPRRVDQFQSNHFKIPSIFNPLTTLKSILNLPVYIIYRLCALFTYSKLSLIINTSIVFSFSQDKEVNIVKQDMNNCNDGESVSVKYASAQYTPR